ncbi:MAG TPA: putative quinol monooxygenase [Lapillicoccus sp.]|uniref:putative quinol monooxygenase n=1 Tax=Lapillicoccus sp. TaxID=1909287 RepID=UPI002F95F747
MSTLDTVALIRAKPGSESVVLDALTELRVHTRAEEGCLRYDLFESAATPGTYVTVEEWTDQAALDQHLGSAHIAAALAAVDGALAGPPAIHPLTPA